ncbi:MAG: phosphoribosylformylglycinamidine cyclo-ligase, partial [Candidatus Omnitrophica bacterium]|nr:phosphoribosylformylglycinamidine cyclo-ligase [Candidatus Omnitrophota bacterium]
MKILTYKKSGVDIKKLDTFKEKLKMIFRGSYSEEVIRGLGGFGGLFRFPQRKYRKPVLVSSSDGVGTKLKI